MTTELRGLPAETKRALYLLVALLKRRHLAITAQAQTVQQLRSEEEGASSSALERLQALAADQRREHRRLLDALDAVLEVRDVA